MSTSIWNLAHPLRTGHIPLAKSGLELFGTVIRHGRMKKTVSVFYYLFANNFYL
jgi:hypothetical protein